MDVRQAEVAVLVLHVVVDCTWGTWQYMAGVLDVGGSLQFVRKWIFRSFLLLFAVFPGEVELGDVLAVVCFRSADRVVFDRDQRTPTRRPDCLPGSAGGQGILSCCSATKTPTALARPACRPMGGGGRNIPIKQSLSHCAWCFPISGAAMQQAGGHGGRTRE